MSEENRISIQIYIYIIGATLLRNKPPTTIWRLTVCEEGRGGGGEAINHGEVHKIHKCVPGGGVGGSRLLAPRAWNYLIY